MEDLFRKCLWKNFGAAIDMLSNVIALCPEGLWKKDRKFFYLTYHTIIFLDYYLTNPVRDFKPVLPYSILDADKLPKDAVDDVIPDEFYSKQDFISYLGTIREKCKNLIILTSQEKFGQLWIDETEVNMHGLCPGTVINYSLVEILFYNFRHVQHHVAQLNLILRQKANTAADWISLVE